MANDTFERDPTSSAILFTACQHQHCHFFYSAMAVVTGFTCGSNKDLRDAVVIPELYSGI